MTQPKSKPPASNELEQEAREFASNNFGKALLMDIFGFAAAFATQVEKRERERCCKDVCAACKEGIPLNKTPGPIGLFHVNDLECGAAAGDELSELRKLNTNVEKLLKQRDAGEPGPRCPKCRGQEFESVLCSSDYEGWLRVTCKNPNCNFRFNCEDIEDAATFFPAERQEGLGTCNLNGNPHQKTCGCIDWMSL